MSLAVTAAADPVTLTFEIIGNGQQIGNFYGGGPGGNFGISFGSGALALVDLDVGGGGFFADEPSPSTVLYLPNAGAAYVDVGRGLLDQIAFFYTQPLDPVKPDTTYSHFTLAVFEGFGGLRPRTRSLDPVVYWPGQCRRTCLGIG
jgi:hypothetical protein